MVNKSAVENTWKTTAPSRSGTYWVRRISTGAVFRLFKNEQCLWQTTNGLVDNATLLRNHEIGPRLPTPEEFVEMRDRIKKAIVQDKIADELLLALQQIRDNPEQALQISTAAILKATSGHLKEIVQPEFITQES